VIARINKLAGHNMGLLIMDPYIYIGSAFLVAGHRKDLAGSMPYYRPCCRYASADS